MTARVLYVPNEWPNHKQLGPRRALRKLLNAGLLSALSVVSPLDRIRSGAAEAAALGELATAIDSFRPDIVLIQHPAGTGLTDSHWAQMRKMAQFQLILHEGDCYGQVRKRLPADTLSTARAADLVLTVGGAGQRALFERAGARTVQWVPSTFDTERFNQARSSITERRWDVVMIANHSPSRVPGMSMPGTAGRAELYSRLQRRFGKRFMAFGRGWRGPSAGGPIAFDRQQDYLRDAWASTTWDHFPREEKFFSDRLPIALASGSHHVGTLHPGYDEVFTSAPGALRFASSPSQAADLVYESVESARADAAGIGSQDLVDYSDGFRDDLWLARWLEMVGVRMDDREVRRALSCG